VSNPPVRLTIRPPRPDDHEALGVLFEHISDDRFHPHPLTSAEAQRIAEYRGPDVYLVGWRGEAAVAYGMLRGWEAGYQVPSLGVAVAADEYRKGFGRQMMVALHAEAARRGASRVRLRVDPSNLPAVRLYQSFGYLATGEERGETVMTVLLGPAIEQRR